MLLDKTSIELPYPVVLGGGGGGFFCLILFIANLDKTVGKQ